MFLQWNINACLKKSKSKRLSIVKQMTLGDLEKRESQSAVRCEGSGNIFFFRSSFRFCIRSRWRQLVYVTCNARYSRDMES